MGKGRRVPARGHQPRDMRHIDVQPGAGPSGDCPHALEINHPRIGRTAGDDQPRAELFGLFLKRVIVDDLAGRIDAIVMRLEPASRQVRLQPVAQMAAGRQVQRQHLVARLQKQEEHRQIGLAAGMRLHIGVAAIEQLFGALDGGIFHHIDKTPAAVKAVAGVAFQRLVCHFVAQRVQHCPADDVLRRDQLDLVLLARFLASQRFGHQRVRRGDGSGEMLQHRGSSASAVQLASECGAGPVHSKSVLLLFSRRKTKAQTHGHCPAPPQGPASERAARV